MSYRIQPSLFSELKREYQYGGDLLKGKRKGRRPFSPKKALHLVFRSDEAKGRWSFLLPSNRKKARVLLDHYINKWQMKLYEVSFNSNHIHLLVKAQDRHGLKRFLRSFPGALAMAVTGAKKGSGLLRKFWSNRVYSRIVEWGRAFSIAKQYVIQNTLEAAGIIPYTPRKHVRGLLRASPSH